MYTLKSVSNANTNDAVQVMLTVSVVQKCTSFNKTKKFIESNRLKCSNTYLGVLQN